MKNIVIVGLLDEFNKRMSKMLCDELDMFFVDIKDMIEYDIANSSEVIQVCGIDYLKKLENKVISNCSTYENVVVNISYEHFIINDNYKLFKENSIIIYIQLSEELLNQRLNCDYYQNINGELVLSVLSYEDRNQNLSKKSDIIIKIDVADIQKCVKLIKKKLKRN